MHASLGLDKLTALSVQQQALATPAWGGAYARVHADTCILPLIKAKLPWHAFHHRPLESKQGAECKTGIVFSGDSSHTVCPHTKHPLLVVAHAGLASAPES